MPHLVNVGCTTDRFRNTHTRPDRIGVICEKNGSRSALMNDNSPARRWAKKSEFIAGSDAAVCGPNQVGFVPRRAAAVNNGQLSSTFVNL
jgi:hypothetical protein